MPAPVPAGYVRGPILFVGACQEEESFMQNMQFFWEEAGAYGSRIVILRLDEESLDLARRCEQCFAEWESDSVTALSVATREEALALGEAENVAGATGIFLLGENPVRMANILGGTPLAQTIRRANARGKVVCAHGRGAALLCEHMIAFDALSSGAPQPFLQRRLIQFAPGLGITNRIVLDAAAAEPGAGWNRLARLLNAVAYNPFLVGVGLEVDTGVVIYADDTLEVFGRNSALIVDASGLRYSDVHEFRQRTPLSLIDIKVHVLAPKFTYHLPARTAHPPEQSDIPEGAVPEYTESQ